MKDLVAKLIEAKKQAYDNAGKFYDQGNKGLQQECYHLVDDIQKALNLAGEIDDKIVYPESDEHFAKWDNDEIFND